MPATRHHEPLTDDRKELGPRLVRSLIQGHVTLQKAQEAPTTSPHAFSTHWPTLSPQRAGAPSPGLSELSRRHGVNKVNTITEESPQRAQTPLTLIQAPRLRSQSPSCPTKELGRRVGGNPEPDKRRLCSWLDTRQAASFPRADLMFLKSLKKPQVCVLPPLVQFCRQQRKWLRLGAMQRAGVRRAPQPILTPHLCPARALHLCLQAHP